MYWREHVSTSMCLECIEGNTSAPVCVWNVWKGTRQHQYVFEMYGKEHVSTSMCLHNMPMVSTSWTHVLTNTHREHVHSIYCVNRSNLCLLSSLDWPTAIYGYVAHLVEQERYVPDMLTILTKSYICLGSWPCWVTAICAWYDHNFD